MKDEEKKYLLDILESIKNIDLHLLGNRDFKFFESNFTSRRAVEREIVRNIPVLENEILELLESESNK
jgi:uncharacterized protein with HEPN domain